MTALGLAGCARVVDPVPLAAGPDPGFFFAGAVPTYGHPVSPAEHNRLAYLRALRRVDPCGLLSRESLAKIGEIGAVGTMFAFDECDVDIKMAGATARRYLSVAVELGTLDHEACQYVAPLLLSRMPGAPALPGPVQPVLRVTPITDQPCDFADAVGRSTGPLPAADRPPIRDALGVYPVRLAERDPCEIVPVLATVQWDIGASRPHMCALTLVDGTAIRVTLQPQLFEPETDKRLRQSRDGVVAFVDTQLCAATVFLGPAMRRKLLGGDYLQPADVVIRPAVTVESSPARCGTVTGIAAAAAKVFG